MGNLIAGMVFFGIGTWPCLYCRRCREDNLFRSAGFAGSLWMIRGRPKRPHAQDEDRPSG